MPEQRRRFSAQFKAEAVQMVIETGRPITEVARDLGIHDGILGNWVNAWRQANPQPAVSDTERARVKEMEDEIRRLRMENEFLEKPRPSSPGRTRSPAVCAHRGGEGPLPDRVDVPGCWGWRARVSTPGGLGSRHRPRRAAGNSRCMFNASSTAVAAPRDGLPRNSTGKVTSDR